jgi:vacuolar-type H+-ATPase subunit I/STV1
MTTRARMWTGLLASAALFSVWLVFGLLLSSGAVRVSARAYLLLLVVGLQASTAAAIFYTASKVTLHRYEVAFEERLRAQVQELNRRIDEMKGIVKQIDDAFRQRSQTLTEEVAAAVREALAREQGVT